MGMEEIRIYHTIWKSCLLQIGTLLFVMVGLILLAVGYSDFYEGMKQSTTIIAGWLSIVFSGFGFIFITYRILKERFGNIPYIIITNEYVEQGNRKVYFADVEVFFMEVKTIDCGRVKQKLSYIQYVEKATGKACNEIGLDANNLSVNPQDYCDLLNEKLGK